MQKAINRGFTLIELLVVIAIIGILAAIVLVSLGNARQKGADAGIQGNLDSIRTQAEVYASDNGNSYGVQATTTATAVGGACGGAGMWTDPTIAQAVKSASGNAGTAQTLNGTASSYVVCGSGANYWAIAVVLKSDPTNTWCVDSSGRAKNTLVSAITTSGTFRGCL